MQFQEIYDKNHNIIRDYFNRLLSPADADDAFQNVWLVIAEKYVGTFLNEQHAQAVCINTAQLIHLEYCNRKARRGKFYENATELSEITASVEIESDRAHVARQIIQQLMPMLHPRHQIVVQMRLNGMSFEAIAQEVGISINACYGRYERAMLSIKTHASEDQVDQFLEAV